MGSVYAKKRGSRLLECSAPRFSRFIYAMRPTYEPLVLFAGAGHQRYHQHKAEEQTKDNEGKEDGEEGCRPIFGRLLIIGLFGDGIVSRGKRICHDCPPGRVVVMPAPCYTGEQQVSAGFLERIVHNFSEEGKMSRGIDFSKLEPEPEPEGADTRRHIVGLDVSAPGQRLDQIMDTLKARYRFYALLLPAQQDGRVNEYIQQRWQQINAMSGETCLVITSLVPAHADASMKEFLVGLFGAEQANVIWTRYRKPNVEQVKNAVYALAQQAQVSYDKLPCIVAMTDFDSRERLILRIPDGTEEELTSFFGDLFSKMNAHMYEPDAARRYKELRSEFGLGFKIKVGPVQMLRKIDWAEVAESFLTNKELIAGIFKVLVTAFGAPA